MTTTVVLALPLAYVGLVGLFGVGASLWAIHGTFLFENGTVGRIVIFKTILYIAPIIAGVIVVIIMLKPIFARPSRRVSPYSIEPQQEPMLFLFVEQIADAVGAPRPRRIELTCEPNAAASLGRSIFSVFGNDLTLVIGMPLIQCLTARQLAGIIAHELGHFTQGFAMRCHYLVGVVQRWFYRVTEETDTWDDHIAEMLDSEVGVILIIGIVSKLAVVLSRLILRLFMVIGHAATCFTLRRMEFNADLAEIRLVGTECFVETCDRLDEIGAAYQFTLQELKPGMRLPNDLPALTESRLLVMPPDLKVYLEKHRAAERTKLFDTHPPTRKRIEYARKQNEPGVVALEAPATGIVNSLSTLCQWTTMRLYTEGFGLNVRLDDLLPVERTVRQRQMQRTGDDATKRWLYRIDRPELLPPAVVHKDIEPDRARALLERTASNMDRNRERLDQAAESLRRNASKQADLAAADALVFLDVKVPVELTHGAMPDSTVLKRTRAASESESARQHKLVDAYCALLWRRMDAARALLKTNDVAASFKDVKSVRHAIDDECKRLELISRERKRLCGMGHRLNMMRHVTDLTSPKNAKALVMVKEVAESLRIDLEALTANGLVKQVPLGGNPFEVFQESEDAIGRAMKIARKSIGRLSLLSDKVARACGVDPGARPESTEDVETSEAAI
ncbi:MAG: M48 family metallopeptidase [Planctomycetota bacterium]